MLRKIIGVSLLDWSPRAGRDSYEYYYWLQLYYSLRQRTFCRSEGREKEKETEIRCGLEWFTLRSRRCNGIHTGEGGKGRSQTRPSNKQASTYVYRVMGGGTVAQGSASRRRLWPLEITLVSGRPPADVTPTLGLAASRNRCASQERLFTGCNRQGWEVRQRLAVCFTPARRSTCSTYLRVRITIQRPLHH